MSQPSTALASIEIRELATLTEMVAAEAIQITVWGTDAIPTPKEMLIPMQHEGGLVAGAFTATGSLVGLVFSFPTHDPTAHHSQLLATLPEWRGQGIGARMKWFQRDWCLQRGVRQVRWTVDPLRVANAQLNMQHLGATAATYLPEYYGPMGGIDAGAPTDRLLVEWQLDSARVAARAHQPAYESAWPDTQPVNRVDGDRPAQTRLALDDAFLRLSLPQDFMRLVQEQPDLALAWRLHTREILLHYFARGYSLTGFTRRGGPAYLLSLEDAYAAH